MKAQAYGVKAVTVDGARRQERLASIKAEIAASHNEVIKGEQSIAFAKADRRAAVKRLDRARKELGAFVEVNMDCIEVKW